MVVSNLVYSKLSRHSREPDIFSRTRACIYTSSQVACDYLRVTEDYDTDDTYTKLQADKMADV